MKLLDKITDITITYLDKKGISCKKQAIIARFGMGFIFFWMFLNMIWITVIGFLYNIGMR